MVLEYEILLEDRNFFLYKLPKNIEFSILSVNLNELCSNFLVHLDSLIAEIKKLTYEYFYDLLIKTNDNFESLFQNLSRNPSSLSLHIEISQYLQSKNYKKERILMKDNQQKIKFLSEILDKMEVFFETDVLSMYFSCISYEKMLETQENSTKNLLLERRSRFQGAIIQEGVKVFEEFSEVKRRIENFFQNSTLEQTPFYAGEAKDIEKELDFVLEKAEISNKNEEILGFEKTDFKGS